MIATVIVARLVRLWHLLVRVILAAGEIQVYSVEDLFY